MLTKPDIKYLDKFISFIQKHKGNPSDIFLYSIPICIVGGVIFLLLHQGSISNSLYSILSSLEYLFDYKTCSTQKSMIPGTITKICFFFALVSACGSYLISPSKFDILRKPALYKLFIVLIFSLLVCTSLVPLFSSWCLGTPQNFAIAGFLPSSDAKDIYSFAETLLDTGSLSGYSKQRPINIIYLAANLLVSGFNFKFVLLLQTLLFGISAALASITVARKFGWANGFLFYGIVFSFVGPYLPTTMSEPLGISLGCLSFVLLFNGIENRSKLYYIAGSIMLGFALMARPGAMIVIPMVIGFAGLLFSQEKKISWMQILFVTFGFVGVFMINSAVIEIYGIDQGGIAFGNFAETFYGLSVDSDWKQGRNDYIGYGILPYGEWCRLLYQRAIEKIVQNPWIIIHAYQIRIQIYGGELFNYLINNISFAGEYQNGLFKYSIPQIILLSGMVLGGIRYFLYNKLNDLFYVFSFLILTGLAISLPFMDGGVRIASPIVPFIAGAIIMMVTGLMKRPLGSSIIQNEKGRGIIILTMIISIGIIGAFIMTPGLGPWVVHEFFETPSNINNNISCSNGNHHFLVQIGSKLPYIYMASGNEITPAFVPPVKLEGFNKTCIGGSYNVPQIQPGSAFMLIYDHIQHRTFYLIIPNEKVPKNLEWRNICAKEIPDSNNKKNSLFFAWNSYLT